MSEPEPPCGSAMVPNHSPIFNRAGLALCLRGKHFTACQLPSQTPALRELLPDQLKTTHRSRRARPQHDGVTDPTAEGEECTVEAPRETVQFCATSPDSIEDWNSAQGDGKPRTRNESPAGLSCNHLQ